MRLIDADEAIRELEDYKDKGHFLEAMFLSGAQEVINKLPTVDPAIHGHWTAKRTRYGLSREIDFYECSNCQKSHCTSRIYNVRFCPYCGAMMDGEVVNETYK